METKRKYWNVKFDNVPKLLENYIPNNLKINIKENDIKPISDHINFG